MRLSDGVRLTTAVEPSAFPSRGSISGHSAPRNNLVEKFLRTDTIFSRAEFLAPKLCLGTHFREAPLRVSIAKVNPHSRHLSGKRSFALVGSQAGAWELGNESTCTGAWACSGTRGASRND